MSFKELNGSILICTNTNLIKLTLFQLMMQYPFLADSFRNFAIMIKNIAGTFLDVHFLVPQPTAGYKPMLYTFKFLVPGTNTFKQDRNCMHCYTSTSRQWRRGPDGRRKFDYFFIFLLLYFMKLVVVRIELDD